MTSLDEGVRAGMEKVALGPKMKDLALRTVSRLKESPLGRIRMAAMAERTFDRHARTGGAAQVMRDMSDNPRVKEMLQKRRPGLADRLQRITGSHQQVLDQVRAGVNS